MTVANEAFPYFSKEIGCRRNFVPFYYLNILATIRLDVTSTGNGYVYDLTHESPTTEQAYKSKPFSKIFSGKQKLWTERSGEYGSCVFRIYFNDTNHKITSTHSDHNIASNHDGKHPFPRVLLLQCAPKDLAPEDDATNQTWDS